MNPLVYVLAAPFVLGVAVALALLPLVPAGRIDDSGGEQHVLVALAEVDGHPAGDDPQGSLLFPGGGRDLELIRREVFSPEFAPPLRLSANSRLVFVRGNIQCDPGERVRIRATVTQQPTGAVAEGETLDVCTGARQDWVVQAVVRGAAAFVRGSARVSAVATTLANGVATDTFLWSRDLTLVAAAPDGAPPAPAPALPPPPPIVLPPPPPPQLVPIQGAGALPAGGQQALPAPAPLADTAALRQRYYDALNRGDVAGVIALYADDATFQDAAGPCRAVICAGREAIQMDVERQVAGNVRLVDLGAQVSGNGVTGRWQSESDWVRAAGLERIGGWDTVEARGDRIASHRLMLDLTDPQSAAYARWLQSQGR